jgi:hypothetical protein
MKAASKLFSPDGEIGRRSGPVVRGGLAFPCRLQREPRLWAIATTQKNNRIDSFLAGFEIPDIEHSLFTFALLVRALSHRA